MPTSVGPGQSNPASPAPSTLQVPSAGYFPATGSHGRPTHEESRVSSPFWSQSGSSQESHSRRPSIDGQDDAQRMALAGYSLPVREVHVQDHRQQICPGGLLNHANPPELYKREVPAVAGPYGAHNYSYDQSAYFSPSGYGYHNGKARKRSNLPKQSTEIMKRWFDENIHNPYPTEEQKRQFAAMAGINLTQVSLNQEVEHYRKR